VIQPCKRFDLVSMHATTGADSEGIGGRTRRRPVTTPFFSCAERAHALQLRPLGQM
jgi:hypothetical protein